MKETVCADLAHHQTEGTQCCVCVCVSFVATSPCCGWYNVVIILQRV